MTAAVAPALQPAEPALADRFVGRRYVQLVLVLGALSAIGPLTIDTYLPAMPELTAELGASTAQAQATLTGLMVGLGLGQLVIGPVSDAVGRRRPLLIGLLAHAVMSLLCAVAPSIGVLTAFRVLQGIAGAAVAVVAMAVVRDLFKGLRAAQLLSRLILVLGVAPILAPSLGSALLGVTTWRGIFVVLAVAAVALFALAWTGLPETLPAERRLPARVSASAKAYGTLFADPMFVRMVVVAGTMFATLMAYVAGAPFILQELYQLTPQQFGLAFGANAAGLILMTQVNPVLVRRFGPVRVLSVAVVVSLVAAVVLLVFAATGAYGLAGFMVPLWFVIAAAGLSFPNAPAIALNRHGEAAGTAAALLGSAQFVIGGSVAPLVGALGNGTAVPMAVVVVGTTLLGTVLMLSARRRLDSVSYH